MCGMEWDAPLIQERIEPPVGVILRVEHGRGSFSLQHKGSRQRG
jgi:hypothetical protein